MVCSEDTLEECVHYPADVFIGIVVSLCCIIGSLENGLVLKLLTRKVYANKSGRVRSGCTNTTYWLLCNLSVADLGNLLIPTPFNAFALIYGRYAFDQKVKTMDLKSELWFDILVNIVGWCSNLFVMVSILLVCVISVRRAVALYAPFKYNYYFKPVNIYVLTALSWLFAIAFACLPFYVSDKHTYMPKYGNSIAHLGKYGTFLELGKAYYIAFLLVVTVIAVTIPALVIGVASFMVVVKLYTRTNIQYKVVKKKQKESEENAARTVTIIPIVFFICHSPVVYRMTTVFIANMYGVEGKKVPPFFKHSLLAKHYMNMIFHFVLLTLNSCVNPLVYLMGSKKLRSTALQYVAYCPSKLCRMFNIKSKSENNFAVTDNCGAKTTKQTIIT